MSIPRTIERVLEQTPTANPATIAEVLEADTTARATARQIASETLARA